MQDFFILLAKTLLTQIIGIFGLFFVFGYILSKIQEKTHMLYRQSIGWKGILWTAWIGTPIHELGHIFFAKLFRHRIDQVHLFRPDKRSGALGDVGHRFHADSLYQKIGNFFIGAAPLLFGSLILFILAFFFILDTSVLTSLFREQSATGQIFFGIKTTLAGIFQKENFGRWQFWILLYISFAVSSHVAPSREDLKGMWHGFAWIILLLIILNAFALLFKFDITEYVLRINGFLGMFIGIFTYATVISLLHLLIAGIVLLPFRKN